MKNNINKSLLLFILGIFSSNGILIYPQPEILRTDDIRFSMLSSLDYSFFPQYTTVSWGGLNNIRMHYITSGDVSAADTILLLHPNMAWSFIYRKMIPLLVAQGYRVVAPDFIGFGRSDKFTDQSQYSHEMFVNTLRQFIQSLNLNDVTLVGLGLGGPVGLSVLKRESSRFKRIIMYNTGMPLGNTILSAFESFSNALQRTALLYSMLSASFFRQGFYPIGLSIVAMSKSTIANANLVGYVTPYPGPRYKVGPAAWILNIPLTTNDAMAVEMQQVMNYLKTSWNGPALYGYSDKEPFFLPGASDMAETFANGCRKDISGAGHLIPEEQSNQMADIIIQFIKNGC